MARNMLANPKLPTADRDCLNGMISTMSTLKKDRDEAHVSTLHIIVPSSLHALLDNARCWS